MSKILSYIGKIDVLHNIDDIIRWIAPFERRNFLIVKKSLNHLGIYIPDDIWKEIIWHVCDYKDIIDIQKLKIKDIKAVSLDRDIDMYYLLKLIDLYLFNPEIQKLNPLLIDNLSPSGVLYITLNIGIDMCINTKKLDVVYSRPGVGRTEGIGGIGEATVYRNDDLMLGIVKDDNIESIDMLTRTYEYTNNEIVMTQQKSNTLELSEFKLENLYTLQGLTNNNKTKIEIKDAFWADRKLFPVNISVDFARFLVKPKNNNISYITIVYATLDNNFRKKLT